VTISPIVRSFNRRCRRAGRPKLFNLPYTFSTVAPAQAGA
jgi:hypothetical protein